MGIFLSHKKSGLLTLRFMKLVLGVLDGNQEVFER
jgi:hypothetical protein